MDGVLKAKEPLRGGSLLFTTKFPGVPGTHLHLIKLGRVNGWVDLEATKWFWAWDIWIGNPLYSVYPLNWMIDLQRYSTNLEARETS